MAGLLQAYPGSLCAGDQHALMWCDGTRMSWDDGRQKSFDEKLRDPDLEDQLSLPYTPGRTAEPRTDPGRIRYQPFFEKMYGASPAAVRARLKPVIWLPGVADRRIRITSINGVDRRLQQISAEILQLPQPIVAKMARVSGTFNWRKIKGTERLSPHSFGIAIDLGGRLGDYWRWDRPGPDGRLRYRNRIPLEVVEVFERHGFIWGGKWYHYDTMHFEYRPELLPKK